MKKNSQQTFNVKNSNKWYLLVVSFLIIGSYSCSHKVQPTATSTTATPPATASSKLTPAQIEAGQTLYAAKCQKCHKLHATTEFTSDKWDMMITKMAPKAKLTDEETGIIRTYIMSSPHHG